MGLKISILNGVSQSEKDRYHMILSSFVSSKKNDTNELIYKTETASQT